MSSHAKVDLGDLGVVEDGGLASLRFGEHIARPVDQLLTDPSVLSAARDALRDQLAPTFLDPFAPAEMRNRQVKDVLRTAISSAQQHGGALAAVPDESSVLLRLFSATVGWGPAQPYLDDPRVQEVQMIRTSIRVQEAGQPFITVPETFHSVAEVHNRATLLASKLNVKLDSSTPQATLPLAHGTRMHVSIAPLIADNGILVCIRRGRTTAWDLYDILSRGTLSQEVADLLQLLCRARCSFLVAGHTGSGKTALLEALANSWPGDPHILTIEDHTMEIVIRRMQTWTREVVDTKKDPHAFGKAAREALRQTPNLVTPGETRGEEAGAILSLVTSDHPVITTIHARSCADAAARFARCATLPNSYMYEGRFTDALVDTCAGFEVVLKIESWEAVGRRLVSEIALIDGVQETAGGLRPTTIPLVQIHVDEAGQFHWTCCARPTAEGDLVWLDGTDRTPAALRDKLRKARAIAAVRLNTSLTVVTTALRRAEDLLLSGMGDRAMATVTQAWDARPDERLARMGQRAIALSPQTFADLTRRADQELAVVMRLIGERQWQLAQGHLTSLLRQAGIAIAAMPVDGWAVIQQQITTGVAQMTTADVTMQQARIALACSDVQTAKTLIDEMKTDLLPERYAEPLLDLKVQIYTLLVERGEGSAQVLDTLRTQLYALRSAVGHVQDAADRKAA